MPLKPEQVKSVADAKKIVEERGLTHVKVGVFDGDAILRGKYMSKAKFFSALENGFGFCDVVLGWDSNDQLFDNVKYTGWHTAYPDAWVRVLPRVVNDEAGRPSGIVAAVMGVVRALSTADAAPDEMGVMIAHALVGTFLGILAGYGFINPVASRIARQAKDQVQRMKADALGTRRQVGPFIGDFAIGRLQCPLRVGVGDAIFSLVEIGRHIETLMPPCQIQLDQQAADGEDIGHQVFLERGEVAIGVAVGLAKSHGLVDGLLEASLDVIDIEPRLRLPPGRIWTVSQRDPRLRAHGAYSSPVCFTSDRICSMPSFSCAPTN